MGGRWGEGIEGSQRCKKVTLYFWAKSSVLLGCPFIGVIVIVIGGARTDFLVGRGKAVDRTRIDPRGTINAESDIDHDEGRGSRRLPRPDRYCTVFVEKDLMGAHIITAVPRLSDSLRHQVPANRLVRAVSTQSENRDTVRPRSSLLLQTPIKTL